MKKMLCMIALVAAALLPAGMAAQEGCDTLHIPYHDDFQQANNHNCWYKSLRTGVFFERQQDDLGNWFVRLYTYTPFPGESTIATPPIDMAADSVYFSFDVNYGGTCTAIYGVMNSTNASTFVPIDTIPLEANSNWLHIGFSTIDLPVSGDLRLAFKVNLSFDSYFNLDNIYIDHAATCEPPENSEVTYVDSTSVTLRWDGSSDHYLVTLYDDDTSFTNSAPSNQLDIFYLEDNHTYSYSIRGVCADGTVTPSVDGSFRTTCQLLPSPYYTDFSDVADYDLPECWRVVYGQYTNYNHPAQSVNSAQMMLYRDAMVTLPLIDIPGNNMHVRASIASQNPSGRLEAGVLPNLHDTSTFIVLKTLEHVETFSSLVMDFYTEDLTLENPLHVAFRWVTESSYSYHVAIDNVLVEAIDSCHAPTATYIEQVTPTAYNLHWVDHSIAPEGYELRYGTVNDVTAADTSIFLLDTFYFLNELHFNMSYYIWVRALCTSEWVAFDRLRTSCGASTLPFHEGFESYINGEELLCWRHLHSDTSGNVYNPYVTEHSNYAHSGNALTLNFNIADTLTLMLPAFGTRGDELEVSFWYYGGTSAMLKAGLTNMTTNEFVPAFVLGASSGPGNTPLHYVFATDTLGITDSVRVTFIYYGPSYFGRASLDDINVRFIPLCRSIDSVTVSDITDTSALVHIHDPWSIGYYRVGYSSEYGSGYVYTYNTDVTIEQLHHSSTYSLTVNGICFDGSMTDTASIFFNTECLSIPHDSLPYGDNFDSYTIEESSRTFRRACWSTFNNNPSDPFFPRIINNNGNNEVQFMVAAPDKSQTIILPAVDYLDDVCLSFIYSAQFYINSCADIEVGVVSDTSDESTFTTVATIHPTTNSVWTPCEVPLTTYFGNGRHPAIRVFATTGTNNFLVRIDSLLLRRIPQCSESIPAVATRDVGATCATLQWKASLAFNDDAHYILHLTDTAGNELQSFTTTDETYTICNLMPTTSYRAYVELYCDSGIAATSPVAGFTMQCEEYNPVSIGNSSTSTTSAYLPLTCSSSESQSQQLYYSDEMQNTSGTLTGITYRYEGVTNENNISCTIYLCNTSDTSLRELLPLSSMTEVYSGPLDLRTGWVNISFARPFHYNGNDNLVVCMVAHADWLVSAAQGMFAVSNSDTNTTLYKVNDMVVRAVRRSSVRFNVCPDVPLYCQPPVIDDAVATDHSITVSYTSDSPCEVHITRGWWNRGFTGTMDTSTAHVYTFDSLRHSTMYTVGVRQHCSVDDLSIWTLRRISTTSIDALPPDTLTVDDITFSTATIAWTPRSDEHLWQLRLFNTFTDTTLTLHNTSHTFSGLRSNIAYNVAARSVYGSFDDVYSDWSDTLVFTTDYCRMAENITVSDVTCHQAHVSWSPGINGNAWHVEYGYAGYSHGEAIGSILVEGQTSTIITGLEPNNIYNLYISTICDSTHNSLWAASDLIYTPDEQGSVEGVDGETAAFILHPNPASSSVTVRWQGDVQPTQAELVDINGKVALRQAVTTDHLVLSLDGLQSGIYFVRLTSAHGTTVRKLIVNR